MNQEGHGKIQDFFCKDGQDMATKFQVTIIFDLLNNLEILLLLSCILRLLDTMHNLNFFSQAQDIFNYDFINVIKNFKHSCIPCVDPTTKFGSYMFHEY